MRQEKAMHARYVALSLSTSWCTKIDRLKLEQRQNPESLRSKMHFNTRILLAITAWAALNYAMAFSIPPNLIAFMALQCVTYTIVGIVVLLPLFLQQKYRRFWIAFSISAIGMLTFSMSENIPSPVAGMLTEYLFQRTGNRDSSFFDDYSVNYAAGIVGKWYAINCVVRLHAALAFSFVAGIVWQKVGSSTPFWLIGTWLFLWSISISREITAAIGVDWTLLVGYLLSVTVIFVLPAIMIHIKKWKPFSVSFAISGCLGCFQLRKNAFDPTFFFSPTVAKWLPNMPSSVGEHVAYALVLGVAVLIGSVVQLAVSKFPTQIQNEDHSLE